MKQYRIAHTSRYLFKEPIDSCSGEIRLIPRNLETQTVSFSQLVFRPLPFKQHRDTDRFENSIEHFEVRGPLQSLNISAIHTVSVLPPRVLSLETCIDTSTAVQLTSADTNFLSHIEPTPLVEHNPAFLDYCAPLFQADKPLLTCVIELAQKIFQEFRYHTGASHVGTTALAALNNKWGVCQDYSHVMLACLRSMGIASRYVSGYIVTNNQTHHQSNNQSHSWVSVFIPQWGWQDIDPTNNQMTSDSYITVAWGRDYNDCAPLVGSVDSKNNLHKLHVKLSIEAV